MTNLLKSTTVIIFAWRCKWSGDKLPLKANKSFLPRNIMFQNMLVHQIKVVWMAPLQPKCSCNFIKICKTTFGIVAACTRTACMFPSVGVQSAIFLHLLQKYFFTSCRNISPTPVKTFAYLLQKYFSTSCFDFHHDTLFLAPSHPPPPLSAKIGSFWRHDEICKTF